MRRLRDGRALPLQVLLRNSPLVSTPLHWTAFIHIAETLLGLVSDSQSV